jgi:Tfp pilus assembly protein PilV
VQRHHCIPRSRPICASRQRTGHTLVELIVACVVFAAGVLATQAATVAVVRQAEDARLRQVAVDAAASRLERLSNAPCSISVDGASTMRGVQLEWSASALTGNHARSLKQTARFALRARRALDVYAGGLRCR